MQTRILCFFSFDVLIAVAASTIVNGDEGTSPQPPVPDGSADGISDWALSGIVWSEANLIRKMALETARQNAGLGNSELAELKSIAEQSESLVKSLEQFGWTRVQDKQSQVTDPRSGKKVPDPKLVGQEIAKSLGLKVDSDADEREPSTRNRVEPFDTETPAGVDDPGIDDERRPNRLRTDIDQYRVDDNIDETPTEARNRADAIEDGVERAIAAANSRGIAGPTTGHISTLATTRAVAENPKLRELLK